MSEKNVGKTDKTVRIVIAVILAILILTGILKGTWAWILGIIGAYILITGLISYCPLYKVLNYSSNPEATKSKQQELASKAR